MAIIVYDDLPTLRARHPRKKFAFCSGSFDLTHAGHVLFFEDCKRVSDILVVAVGKDEDIKAYKEPGRPILNEHVRIKMVDSLKPVDYCFFNRAQKQRTHYLASIEEIFEQFKPDVWVVNGDGAQMENRKKLAVKFDVQLLIFERVAPSEFEHISTTAIIRKIRGL